MKFLVDAQLPRRLSERLAVHGHDSVHTLDLPNGNRTPDHEINRISIEQQRIVVTKDSDFVDSLLLRGEPWKLLVVATGNIRNADLLDLFDKNIVQIVDLFQSSTYVELTVDSLIVHL
jgi:predicted nuclease of predicted toxin-antitoxin system